MGPILLNLPVMKVISHDTFIWLWLVTICSVLGDLVGEYIMYYTHKYEFSLSEDKHLYRYIQCLNCLQIINAVA